LPDIEADRLRNPQGYDRRQPRPHRRADHRERNQAPPANLRDSDYRELPAAREGGGGSADRSLVVVVSRIAGTQAHHECSALVLISSSRIRPQ
jgi:hypothetical protein